MKKFISLIMAVFCVAAFSMSVFADSTEIQPRAEVCPLCDHGSLVEVRGNETHASTRYEPCSHGKLGYDEYLDHYATFYKKCTNGSCNYTSAGTDRVYWVEFIRCGGL